MEDKLRNKIHQNESMIINLNYSPGQRTHWVGFVKQDLIITKKSASR